MTAGQLAHQLFDEAGKLVLHHWWHMWAHCPLLMSLSDKSVNGTSVDTLRGYYRRASERFILMCSLSVQRSRNL